MSQEHGFLETLYPPTYRVLGRELLPMEVGHWLLLERLGKLMMPPCEPRAGDLALAAYVCARPSYMAARRVAEGGWLFRLGLWASARSGARFERALTTWRAYVAFHLAAPRFRERGGGQGDGAARTLNAPYWLVYLRRAMAAGLSDRDALAVPMRLAIWQMKSAEEDSGAIVWLSEAEMAIQDIVGPLQRGEVLMTETESGGNPLAAAPQVHGAAGQVATAPEATSHA
jgi:hypothetical protein